MTFPKNSIECYTFLDKRGNGEVHTLQGPFAVCYKTANIPSFFGMKLKVQLESKQDSI